MPRLGDQVLVAAVGRVGSLGMGSLGPVLRLDPADDLFGVVGVRRVFPGRLVIFPQCQGRTMVEFGILKGAQPLATTAAAKAILAQDDNQLHAVWNGRAVTFAHFSFPMTRRSGTSTSSVISA